MKVRRGVITQGSTAAGRDVTPTACAARRRATNYEEDDEGDEDGVGEEGAAACEVPVEPLDESAAGFVEVVDSDEELEPLSVEEPSEPDVPVDDDEPDDVPLRASFL